MENLEQRAAELGREYHALMAAAGRARDAAVVPAEPDTSQAADLLARFYTGHGKKPDAESAVNKALAEAREVRDHAERARIVLTAAEQIEAQAAEVAQQIQVINGEIGRARIEAVHGLAREIDQEYRAHLDTAATLYAKLYRIADLLAQMGAPAGQNILPAFGRFATLEAPRVSIGPNAGRDVQIDEPGRLARARAAVDDELKRRGIG